MNTLNSLEGVLQFRMIVEAFINEHMRIKEGRVKGQYKIESVLKKSYKSSQKNKKLNLKIFKESKCKN